MRGLIKSTADQIGIALRRRKKERKFHADAHTRTQTHARSISAEGGGLPMCLLAAQTVFTVAVCPEKPAVTIPLQEVKLRSSSV